MQSLKVTGVIDDTVSESSPRDFQLDLQRTERIGFGEAIFCLNKTTDQISAILAEARRLNERLLLTRLSPASHTKLVASDRDGLDYDQQSQTAFLGPGVLLEENAQVAVVTAGSSDAPAALEAMRTLQFHGIAADPIFDVGVAGLWRVLKRMDQLRTYPIVIAVAGMDAALPSVLGGLLGAAIIAVPTATGYGVAAGGQTALHAILASCAPGISVVNIDNGYGAACAALRILQQIKATNQAN